MSEKKSEQKKINETVKKPQRIANIGLTSASDFNTIHPASFPLGLFIKKKIEKN